MRQATAKWLGLAGLLPFIGLTLAVLTNPMGWAGTADQALRIYAALILSFIGGVSWGIALRGHDRLFALSMVPFFGAWTALLFNGRASYACLIGSFLLAHAIDHYSERHALFPEGFIQLRKWLTAVVTLCLLVAALGG
jgi:hypothetical protein